MLLVLVLISRAGAQQYAFSESDAQDPATLSKAVVRLAGQALAVYKDDDREKYLSGLWALQAVAGQYPEAAQSFVALRDFRRSAHISNAAWRDLQFEVYVRAKAAASARNLPFDEAYKEAFRAVFGQLDDSTSAGAMPLFNVADESWADPALQSDLDAQKGKSSIALDAAVALVSDYEAVQGYRASASLRSALIAPDIAAFLQQRLPVERQASPNTCDSYAHAFRLLFEYASNCLKITPSQLQVEHIDATLIVDFLNHLEATRGNGAGSRNIRLAAIKSFMRYIEYRVPSALEQIRCILSIPTKKTDVRLVRHLTAPEMQSILDAPDPARRVGIRDRAMLHLCFAGGLRVSELVGLRVVDVRLQPEPNVLIRGPHHRS